MNAFIFTFVKIRLKTFQVYFEKKILLYRVIVL